MPEEKDRFIQISYMTDSKNIIPVTLELTGKLAALWEESVRATHFFLAEEDIISLRPLVEEAFGKMESLWCICREEGEPEAFMGICGSKLEMLFVHPLSRGKGLGKTLVEYALHHSGVRYVDVNEQNPQAVGFYEYIGFYVFARSDVDSGGRPFPILHMKYRQVKNR